MTSRRIEELTAELERLQGGLNRTSATLFKTEAALATERAEREKAEKREADACEKLTQAVESLETWQNMHADAERERDAALARVKELERAQIEPEKKLDEAYNERNHLVALLARIYPSGIRKTAIEGWDPCWHGCVFVDTPMGQMSWHYHDRDAGLFAGLPPYTKDWDGHSTPEKYARLERLTRSYWGKNECEPALSEFPEAADAWLKEHP